MKRTLAQTAITLALLASTTTATANSSFADLIRMKAKETVSEAIATQAGRAADGVLDKAVTRVVDSESTPAASDHAATPAATTDPENGPEAVDDYPELDDSESVE